LFFTGTGFYFIELFLSCIVFYVTSEKEDGTERLEMGKGGGIFVF
jgi:hypothetical protein